MKNKIIFLAVLLSACFLAEAQQNNDSFSAPLKYLQKGKQTKLNRGATYLFDSLYFYRDDFHNLELASSFREVAYEPGTDKLLSVNIYVHTGTSGKEDVYKLRHTAAYEYTASETDDHNFIIELYYDIDNSGEKHVFTRLTCEYDGAGILLSASKELFDSDISDWKNNVKYTYSYNNDGKLDEIHTFWGPEDWEEAYYEQYHYKNDGKIDYIEGYNIGKKDAVKKRTYHYNAENLVESIEDEQNDGGSWSVFYTITFTYDADNDIISSETSSGFKFTFEYDKTIDIKDISGPYEEYFEYYMIDLFKHPVTKQTSYLYQFEEWQVSTSMDLIYKTNTQGVDNFSENNSLSIYPNPVVDRFSVTLENNETKADMKIFDNTGRLVLNKVVKNNENIDVSELKSGIYFIQTRTAKSLFTNKIVIEK